MSVFGVQLPNASMGDNDTPKLLVANSAVKFANGVKNICAEEALSDSDRYRAVTTLTGNCQIHKFSGSRPYLITWIKKK
jgi:hypothetical protein